MNCVRFSIESGEVSTYPEPIDFLDNQLNFKSVLGNNPTLLRTTRRSAGTYAIADTAYWGKKLTAYCDLRQLHLFCDIIQLQNIETTTYDTHSMLHDIYLALSGLKFVSKDNGKIILLIPHTLYQHFIELFFLLPPMPHLGRKVWSLFL